MRANNFGYVSFQFIEWLAFIYYGVSVSERIFAIVCSVLPTINSGDEQKTTQLTGMIIICSVFVCMCNQAIQV